MSDKRDDGLGLGTHEYASKFPPRRELSGLTSEDAEPQVSPVLPLYEWASLNSVVMFSVPGGVVVFSDFKSSSSPSMRRINALNDSFFGPRFFGTPSAFR